MDNQFTPNNTHLEDAKQYASLDPHLKRLYRQPYIFHSDLLKKLPRKIPGIYTLGGGRQVGKSTLLKQWIEQLLKEGTCPEAIAFFSGELIRDYHHLYNLVQNQLSEMPRDQLKFLIIDEITYIDDWDKTIKYLADLGEFEQVIIVLTGSDLVLMQDARKRFPGRRGMADVVDFHYYPLSFREYLILKKIHIPDEKFSQEMLIPINSAFENYLVHGGFMTAINDHAANQTISKATLTTYADWIRGDFLKRKKNETFLMELLQATLKYQGSQISWDNLLKELSIDHTQTVSDYMQLLSSMDAITIQQAILEDKLLPAPKKRKKILFNDPFIHHAVHAWLKNNDDPFTKQIKPTITDPETCATLVEAVAISHYRRYYPTYYIKAKGEVDIAYVDNDTFWPIEIKWTSQIRPKDLTQVLKYPNGKIFAKTNTIRDIQGTPVYPLPLALAWLDAT